MEAKKLILKIKLGYDEKVACYIPIKYKRRWNLFIMNSAFFQKKLVGLQTAGKASRYMYTE